MQDVIEKAVLLIPQSDCLPADIVHGLADVDEVLEEFAGDIFVRAVLAREFGGNGEGGVSTGSADWRR